MIFYCPECKELTNQLDKSKHKIVWANCRDGCGRGIYHIICPFCQYELSGIMNFDYTEENIEYVKCIIGMYSDRTFIDVDRLIEFIRAKL
jgi:hypothetical protein